MNTAGIKMVTAYDEVELNELKQSLILFDKIGIPGFKNQLNSLLDLHFTFAPSLDLLQKQGYIFSFEPSIIMDRATEVKSEFHKYQLTIESINSILALPNTTETYKSDVKTDAYVRYFSLLLNHFEGENNYVPLVKNFKLAKVKNLSKSDVIRLVIENLPTPDKNTSWESIIEFKSNPDNIGKFAGLSNWMNNSTKSGSSIAEIKDELEYKLYQYRKSLELHKIKYHSGRLQRIIVGTAELIENTARLKFSNIAKGLFSTHHEKIDLLNAELTAPGSEIAYLYEAQKILRKVQ